MISPVVIPDLGTIGGDVILEEWLVEAGQQVTAGQPLFVLTTDKASVEVEAFRAGIIRELKVDVGQSLPIGAVVALLSDSPDEPLVLAVPVSEPERTTTTIQERPIMPATSLPGGQRIFASPLARRIAAEEAVDLGSLRGSGIQGQILKRDVIAAIADREQEGTQMDHAVATRELLSPMQRSIAELTQRSKRHAPHFYAAITIDMRAALEVRQQVVAWAGRQGLAKPSINDLCIKAAALTLRDFPMLNASFDGEAITSFAEINIGLVIGLEQGMLVPVIRRADYLDLYTIATATQRLREQAAAGQLSAKDLSGGTFTLSNLGMYGLDSFTAVINPPQTGILALGAVHERPGIIDGKVAPLALMTATLSVDHRVIDGISAARFVAAFKEMLENPTRLEGEAEIDKST